MRRSLLAFLILTAPLAACSPAAAPPAGQTTDAAGPPVQVEPVAARGKRMELVNNARRGTLVRLEVAPIENREKFREIVAARGLAQDAEKTVSVGPGCVYDMRAKMADGALLYHYRVDLCFRNRIFLLDWPAEGQAPEIAGQAPQ